MTILFNVTDAIGPASNHGITRVERKLAEHLLGEPSVRPVVMHDRRIYAASRPEVVEALHRPVERGTPSVERFGVDPVPAAEGRLTRAIHAFERTRRAAAGETVARLSLGPIGAQPGDVLVSVGLDWTHGLIDEAERLVYGVGVSYVGFCYDTIPVDHPEWLFPPDPVAFRGHLRRMARLASRVLCISEHTRDDFARVVPEYPRSRLAVLTLGADAAVETGPAHDEFAASIFDGAPYAVYCATLDRRKNHQVLYRAMRELVRRGVAGHLVFVGMIGSGVGDLVNALRNDPVVRGRIAHVTDCDDRHLAAIYRQARFAVYPSLYEGWGLGVTEAMAHGKTCVVASGSSLGEASLGAARIVHPLKTGDWADAMSELFVAPLSRPDLALPTWDQTASDLLGVVAQ